MTPAQLNQLFVRERTRFAEMFPRAADARLIVSYARCISPNKCAHRNLAYTAELRDGAVVMMHHRVLDLPRVNVIGLIRHELGHVSDANVRSSGREQRADDIAELVTGHVIRYDARDVETVGPGSYPRSRSLPR